MASCAVGIVDEVHGTKNQSRFGGGISHYQTQIGAFMKALITEPKIRINPKGINPYYVPNCILWVFITDKAHGLGLDPDDRRMNVFIALALSLVATPNEKLAQKMFFKKLSKEIEDPEAILNFVHYLINEVDISNFDPTSVLETSHRSKLVWEGAIDVILMFLAYVEQFQPDWKKLQTVSIIKNDENEDEEIYKEIDPPHLDCEKNVRLVSVSEFFKYLLDNKSRGAAKVLSKTNELEIAKKVASWLNLDLKVEPNHKSFIEVPNDWETFKANQKLSIK